jgi:hypothetical protein
MIDTTGPPIASILGSAIADVRCCEHLSTLGISDHVAVIEAADSNSPSLDSPSLRNWLDQAGRALAAASDA